MSQNGPKKMNRAKARLQRRAEEMEAQRREAAAEAADMPDLKAQESGQMKSKLDSMGLVEHDVCLSMYHSSSKEELDKTHCSTIVC